ncbi:coiled-coil domain-containing protein 81-like isoform X1 [Alosa pseudoharengus]|uniref:coiled-coil domain-containing protein 81-like isoform X1 n=1 Tax=Alosa pseudoharengus TaxID=34774 RepID=UPI003F8A0A00
MTDILLSVVSEAKHAFPTLSQLSETDVDDIWSNVSSFVERQMSLQKGVHINGLGRFTFCQQKMDVGSKYVLIQRPVFLLSEKLSQAHGLKQVKPQIAAGDVPEVPLNFSALAAESPFERDVIEGCIRETLMLLLRAVASQRSVLFTFRGIGVLVFRNSKVKMHFYKDFVTSMDGSGKALWALSNRPGTSNSLLSEKFYSQDRPGTSNTIHLPHITSRAESVHGKTYKPSSALDSVEEQEKGASEIQCQSKSRKGSATTKDNGVSLIDKLYTKPTKSPQTIDRTTEQPVQTSLRATNVRNERSAQFSLTCQDHKRAGQELCYLCMQRAKINNPLYLSEERQREEDEEARLLLLLENHKDHQYLQDVQAEKNQIRENHKKVAAFNLEVAEALKKKRSTRSSHFHPSYIFGGRLDTPPNLLNRQNYQEDLRRQASCLVQNQKLNQQSQDLIDHLQQVQLSHEIGRQKAQFLKEKHKNSESYKKALDTQVQVEQVKPKVHFKKRLLFPPIKKDSDRTERTEQAGEYQGTGIPARMSDSVGPFFGVLDSNPEDLAVQRHMAQAVQQEQLWTTTHRKQEAMFNKLMQLKREREMLKRNHKELMEEHISHYEKLCNLRKSLEMTWSRSANLKRQRDKEEREFIRSGSRLLISQCEQYRRCTQCKRTPANSGESNLWKETHFIPESRLMV